MLTKDTYFSLNSLLLVIRYKVNFNGIKDKEEWNIKIISQVFSVISFILKIMNGVF